MFWRIRKRLTYTNVGVTLALVFAMSGGAYAAGKFVITSTKQIKPNVLKQLQGKAGANGAAGPAGPQGPAGANGKDGVNGKDGAGGKDGVNGTSVTSAVEPKGANCAEGGSKFTAASGTSYACNGKAGKEGSPWTAGGTLPSGSTETGAWSIEGIANAEGELKMTSVSFAIPLKIPPKKYGFVPVGGTTDAEISARCKGSAENPEAVAGNICLYEGGLVLFKGGLGQAASFNPSDPTRQTVAGVTGSALLAETLKPLAPGAAVSEGGTWAVTAE